MKALTFFLSSLIFISCQGDRNADLLQGNWTMKKVIQDSGWTQVENVSFLENNKLRHELIVVGKSKMNSEGLYQYRKDSQLLYTTLESSHVKFKVLRLSPDMLQLLDDESKNVLLMQRRH